VSGRTRACQRGYVALRALGATGINQRTESAGELAQKFLFIHAVFEGFATVNEDDRDLVVVLTAEVGIGVNIHVAPVEATALMEFDEALLDDFAEMTPLPGIDDYFPMLHNSGSLAGWNRVSKTRRA
jgi:hypothetical protein